MVHPENEYSIPPASPDEVGPQWQELEILPGPTRPEEKISYLEGYAAGQKAVIFLLAQDFASEQLAKKEQSARAEEWERVALTDGLTELPNRLGITREIESLIESQPGSFGLLFVDLDGLKKKNDTEGHEAGNQFIIGAAAILEGGVRTGATPEHPEPRDQDVEGRTAARLSGDEFVVIIKGITTEEQLEQIGARLRKRLDSAGIPASLGAALHRVGESATDIISRSDFAMYEVKGFRRELRQEVGRDNLPEERRELYDEVAIRIWEYVGASEEEFHEYYGYGGR